MGGRCEARGREEKRREILERLNAAEESLGCGGDEGDREARSEREREIEREKALKYGRMHWGNFF